MIHVLIYFSVLTGRLLEEEHPPAEAMPFNLGLSPFGVVVIVLLVTGVAWLAINVQAGRADLHAAAYHDDHEQEAHAPETSIHK